MKQVIFAIALLAMASLTGCLNTEDSPVDENIDTTDDSTSDTTEDNTDTTQDDTDTTEDTKDDELIEPVGGNGDIIIPEDSSIFIDSMPYGINEMGQWECDGYEEDRVCNYVFYDKDTFPPGGNYQYVDSDGIKNSIDFNGWVNKTGNTVTIEGLKYPDRVDDGRHTNSWWEWVCCDEDENEYQTQFHEYTYDWANKPVSETCNQRDMCQIVFYGHNGLIYNGWFTLSGSSTSWPIFEDTDDDGIEERTNYMVEYAHYTVIFDLPFEPYAFSIMSESGHYQYDLEQQYHSVDRIF